jgi:UDP-3-O-acyl-N-acetylglucosamine deacetylase
MTDRQQTLAGAVELSGVGIHSGEPGSVRILPAPVNSGLTFVVGRVEIPAAASYVLSTRRCTVLGREGAAVSTVEHLLAALYGLGIDNARMEVAGPEIPILDGSAGPFVQEILAAGLQEQDAPARSLTLSRPLWSGAEGASADAPSVLALPAEGLTVTVAVDFCRAGVERQVFTLALLAAPSSEPPGGLEPEELGAASRANFVSELAPARTFCFEDEVAALLAAGHGLGGSLENTLVVSERGTSTPLRYPDELARHKALDLLGDLALVGARLNAHVIALRAGHTLHVAMANAIGKADARHQTPVKVSASRTACELPSAFTGAKNVWCLASGSEATHEDR